MQCILSNLFIHLLIAPHVNTKKIASFVLEISESRGHSSPPPRAFWKEADSRHPNATSQVPHRRKCSSPPRS